MPKKQMDHRKWDWNFSKHRTWDWTFPSYKKEAYPSQIQKELRILSRIVSRHRHTISWKLFRKTESCIIMHKFCLLQMCSLCRSTLNYTALKDKMYQDIQLFLYLNQKEFQISSLQKLHLDSTRLCFFETQKIIGQPS